MTTGAAETSPLIYAKVAGLRAPQVIATGNRYVALFIYSHKGGN